MLMLPCSHYPPEFVIAFPFRGVAKSQSAEIFSWRCSAHSREVLAQLLCEKSRLLEGGEVPPSLARFRLCVALTSDTLTKHAPRVNARGDEAQ